MFHIKNVLPINVYKLKVTNMLTLVVNSNLALFEFKRSIGHNYMERAAKAIN